MNIKTITILVILITSAVFVPKVALSESSNNHTAREEAEGKAVWDKLQTKQLECKNLTDDNFETLGEYFMGQMTGSSHEAMNTMMERMIGQAGEQQMHVVMGKRLSGCDTSAQVLPPQGVGLMPMIWMMGGGNPMMGWGGSGFIGLFLTLFWLLVLVDLTLLGVWLWKKIRKEK